MHLKNNKQKTEKKMRTERKDRNERKIGTEIERKKFQVNKLSPKGKKIIQNIKWSKKVNESKEDRFNREK